jgi:hypothetical protein
MDLKFFYTRGISVIHLFLLWFLPMFAYSQCPGGEISVSIQNVTANSNSIEFDVYLRNTGTAAYGLQAFTTAINMVTSPTSDVGGGVNGGLTVITQPSSAGFPGLNPITPSTGLVSGSRQLRGVNSPLIGSSVNMPIGLDMHFARYRYQKPSGNFTSNTLVTLTHSNSGNPSAQAAVFCGGSTTTFTIPLGTVIAPTTPVTLNPQAAGPTASVLSGNATICNGSSTNLNVAITGGTSPYTVVYNDGTNNFTVNNYVSGTNIPVSPTTTTTYSLVSVTDASSNVGTGNSGTALVTVNNPVTPTFTQVPAICAGGSLSALPTTSTNGITGTWSPALNNAATTTYTFTPNVGQCGTTTTMTITVNPNVTPTFDPVAAICAGATLSALPTTSTNGITGIWSPALNNAATTTYTFTPDAGQCATTATMTITVTPNVTPTFTAVSAICAGATLSALPTTSTNGITGTWSPALNNAATTTYTFTPTAGQCATTTTLTITVNPILTPSFVSVPAICLGGTLSALPTTSTNGISGTWSPALNNAATTTYTFTPNVGQCGTTTTMTITVNPLPTPSITGALTFCPGASTTLDAGSFSSYLWTGGSSAQTLSVTTAGTFSVQVTDGNGCSASTSVTTSLLPLVSAGTISGASTLCIGATSAFSSNGNAGGTWSSSNTLVATVNPTTGLVSAVGPGNANIIYTLLVGCGSPTNASRALTVSPNYTITATAGANGIVSPSGVSNVCSGGSLTYSITPSVGYQILNVDVNGVSVGTPNSYTFTNVTANQTINATFLQLGASNLSWIRLNPGTAPGGSCTNATNCCTNTFCYGLQYTPGATGSLNSYTTGFFLDCVNGSSPIISNASCIMSDNSGAISDCAGSNSILFNSSGNNGSTSVTAGVPIIIHQVCFDLPNNTTANITEDLVTDLTCTIDLPGGGTVEEFPVFSSLTIRGNIAPVVPANGAETVQCFANAVTPVFPVVADECGNNIIPVMSIVNSPLNFTCEGTRTYLFDYNACSGLVSTWQYVYTIDHTTAPVVPVNGAATVQCLASATIPATIPVVMDVCGAPIVPVLVSTTDNLLTPNCEGTRTYLYSYTDCAGLVSNWSFVYTIDRTSLPVVPANGAATVQCLANATAPSTPTVVDVCGGSVAAVLVSTVDNPTSSFCEGTRTYNYTYTDCSGLVSNWSFVYTIDHTSLPVVPVNGSATVQCLANAVAPTTPTVVDVCGANIIPTLVTTNDLPATITCEGSRTYNYTYTDCAGLASNWSFVYTIDRTSAPVVPANGGSVVNCLADATTPTPPTVVDVCGGSVSAVLVSTVTLPNSLTCEGTRTYNYTYTDCSGLVSNWSYVYTIDHTTVPVVPSNGSATVQCLANAIAPTTPTVVDVCGAAIVPTLVSTVDNPATIVCEGSRTYNYTYTDCSGLVSNWSFVYTIDRTSVPVVPANGAATVQCLANATAPTTPVVVDVCGSNVTAVLASTVDNPTTSFCEGTRTYNYTYTDCSGLVSNWSFVYTIDHSSVPVVPANGASTVQCLANATAPTTPTVVDVCGAAITPVLVSTVDNPGTFICEGTRTYTYSYTDCAGLVSNWVYVYTIDHSSSPVVPVNGSATVNCLTDAIAPTTPTVVDVCGASITPVLVSTVTLPNTLTCEGTRTYTYSYTDCAGLVSTWSFVYQIDHTTSPIVPANGSITVECLANAVPPTTPTVVDVCGSSIPAVLVSTLNTPTTITCEGSRTYNYTYTDCAGLVSNWSFVYTIDRTTLPVVPVNGAATVQCLANATAPTTFPTVVDVCGTAIVPVLASTVDAPVTFTCEGTRTYNYTYTDCSGLVSSWSFVYTIDHSTAPVVPANGAATVQCLANATAPTTPTVVDVCGASIAANLVSMTDVLGTPNCEGTRTYIYSYEDCAGLVSTWTFVYTIDQVTSPVIPANGTSTVECLASAVPPTAPAVVDACGNTISPVLVSTVTSPTTITCEGTRTYTYSYTSCSGFSGTWVYTYVIDRATTLPTQFGGPVATSSTIQVNLDAVAPTLPVIRDVCGNTLSPVGPVIGGTFVSGNCSGTITYSYTYTDCAGNSIPWVYTYNVDCGQLNIKVYLEGPYNLSTDLMTPTLNANRLLPGQDKMLNPSPTIQGTAPFTPFGHPYSGAPWNYSGNTGMNYGDATAPSAPMGVLPYPSHVIDWVLVTVRENGILPANNVFTCAGWVHTNGRVSFPQSCSGLTIDPGKSYYIVVQHRNHLGALDTAAIMNGATNLKMDFTIQDSYKPAFRFGQKQVEPGVWALMGANSNQSSSSSQSSINSADRNTWRLDQNKVGYLNADHQMNVNVNSADETIWKVNQNRTSGVIFQ